MFIGWRHERRFEDHQRRQSARLWKVWPCWWSSFWLWKELCSKCNLEGHHFLEQIFVRLLCQDVLEMFCSTGNHINSSVFFRESPSQQCLRIPYCQVVSMLSLSQRRPRDSAACVEMHIVFGVLVWRDGQRWNSPFCIRTLQASSPIPRFCWKIGEVPLPTLRIGVPALCVHGQALLLSFYWQTLPC